MKILVTGATGFIGRNLVKRLLEENHDVVCGIRSFRKLGSLKDRVKAVRIYLEYMETVEIALEREKPEAVYHSAALVESLSLEELRRVNREGTRNVLKACLEKGVKRVIYLSTVAVATGNPEVPLTENLPLRATNPYGQSKLEAEEVALEYRKKGLRIALIRPCMVYGIDEPHGLSRLVEGLRRRVIPVFGTGKNRLHLVSVENVVDVLLLCLRRKEAYQGAFFVADKEALSIKELFGYIAGIIGAKPPITVPQSITDILKRLPFIGRKISFLMKDRVYSIDRLREKLGYVPRVSVYDGLKEAVLARKVERR
jgi:nucleoside-diphosphate-sugar epimerase